jgi:hypothetical protein
MIVVASPKAPPSTVITINEHGAILLPMDAYEALGEPPFIRIGYAVGARAFALEAASDKRPKTRRASVKRGRLVQLWCSDLPRHFRLTETVKLPWGRSGDMLVVRL